ncbi:MAG: hypothetical protein SFT68_00530 [Rickettsiaceae bacterium]|nr:hypothetical protein [Rickettsiaceae bacterium]
MTSRRVVIPTKVGIQNKYLLRPFCEGVTRGKSVIPTKVGI